MSNGGDSQTPVLVQGTTTDKEWQLSTQQCISYDTEDVTWETYGKSGQRIGAIHVFIAMQEASDNTEEYKIGIMPGSIHTG